MIDTWIYCTPAAWAAIGHVGDEVDPYPSESWVKPYRQAITGFWKTWDTDYEVYNTIGSEASIQALVDELGPGVARTFGWTQGPGTDSLDEFTTLPDDVLAVMRDFIDYDGDGNPIGSTPPTVANPNWGHLFLGQSERIFAGEFSNEFTGEYL